MIEELESYDIGDDGDIDGKDEKELVMIRIREERLPE